MLFRNFSISQAKLIIATALFMAVFHNQTFLQKVFEAYSSADHVGLIILSLIVFHSAILVIILALLGFNRGLKPVLITLLIISSVTSYFIDTYNIVIDKNMIANLLETNPNEAADLIHPRLFIYIFLLGLAPSFLILRSTPAKEKLATLLFRRTGLITGSLVVLAITVFISSDFYFSFIREHKMLRDYANPTTAIDALVKFTGKKLHSETTDKILRKIATDAHIEEDNEGDFKLVVMVVGETARADHFSLNGYERQTNPLLSAQNVISFSQVASCGTTTAESLPCMFSLLERDHYERSEADTMENILDILKRTGVNILWRDNNSGSKGVANRVEYQDFSSPEINPACNTECRDIGMLSGLDEWLAKHQKQDILIVMHQLGSHGPAYYKRYPPEFEKFKETCKTNQLDQCDSKAIINTYDNTILYTDFFLSSIIDWLKSKNERYETAMLYFSDHGESLGESGLYLHGMPYRFAPEAQTHVPAIFWTQDFNEDFNLQTINENRDADFSHDNIFHTLLGLFEVKSEVYDLKKDMLHGTSEK